MSLEAENAKLTAENVSLREHLDGLSRSDGAKYRRVDCLRIAQKYVEDQGGDLVRLASSLTRFVETGDDGQEAKQPDGPSSAPITS